MQMRTNFSMNDRNLSIRPLNGKMRLIHGLLLFRMLLLLSLEDVDEVIEEDAAEDADDPSTFEDEDKDVKEF